MHINLSRFWVLLTVPVIALAQPADDARKAFDSLYGEKVKAVRATSDRADDLDMARKLTEGAIATEDAPDLVALMCNAAYDLSASHPGGHAVAAQALRTLIEKAPGRVIDAPDRLVEMLRRIYGRSQGEDRAVAAEQLIDAMLLCAKVRSQGGDHVEAIKMIKQAVAVAEAARSPRTAEVKAHQEQAQGRAQVDGQLQRALARLKTNPKDAAAHAEIAKVQLVEFNDPTKALPHAEASGDAQLKAIVAMSAKQTQSMSDKECLQLGDWLRTSAATASPQGKAQSLARAKECYAQYLATTKDTGLSPATAKLSLEEVTKSLASLAAVTKTLSTGEDKPVKGKVLVMETLAVIKPEDGWVDVMKVIDPTRAHRGEWSMDKGKLTRKFPENYTLGSFLDLPFETTDMSYEVELAFERSNGDHCTAGIFLHIGRAETAFTIADGPKGDRSGLNHLNGKPFFQNETYTEKVAFPAAKVHVVLISVKVEGENIHFKSTANGKPFVEWKGSDTSFPGRRYPKIGLSGWGTTTYHSVRLRAINGQMAPQPYGR